MARNQGQSLSHLSNLSATQGFEAKDASGFIRYLEHGVPSPLVRWHYHEEYELHLILETSGKVFVGDYIGQFSPGHLVLTGPRVPHYWVSTSIPDGGIALRDAVLQFPRGPLEVIGQQVPEFRDIFPMLNRSLYGIEFFGLSQRARECFFRIRELNGFPRFLEFLGFMGALAQSNDYRLLSSVQMQSSDDDASLAKISSAISFIIENYSHHLSMSEIARDLGMSDSKFSRFFRTATGNSFTDFVSRLRINRACQLLMETDRYIANVCYEVGFNNIANFNRRFLDVKGMTPKEFRSQAQGRFGS